MGETWEISGLSGEDEDRVQIGADEEGVTQGEEKGKGELGLISHPGNYPCLSDFIQRKC